MYGLCEMEIVDFGYIEIEANVLENCIFYNRVWPHPGVYSESHFPTNPSLKFDHTDSNHNMQILDTNPQLYFHLQQQKLIELICAGKINEALEFAQEVKKM